VRKQRIIIVETCDYCPADDSKEVTGTFTVGYGSAQYELDLCADHKTRLDESISQVIRGARKRNPPVRKRGNDTTRTQLSREARAWAIETNRPVNRTGHVPQAIISEYQQYLRDK
jgi:hypothetical protein